jgi:hypothetical protein
MAMRAKSQAVLDEARARPGEWVPWTGCTGSTVVRRLLEDGAPDAASFELESRLRPDGRRWTYLRFTAPATLEDWRAGRAPADGDADGPAEEEEAIATPRVERRHDGKARCPHCLNNVAPRTGELLGEALLRHGRDRPYCMAKIRALPAL